MSNVFPRGVHFVPFPAAVAESLADLTEAEIRLYTGLLAIAQKRTATKLHLPAFVVHDYTGLHSETVAIARRKLDKRNLIRCGKGAGGVTIYELINPVTGETLPALVIGKRKFSGTYIYKPDYGRSSRTTRTVPKVVSSPPATVPSWEELDRSEPIQSVSMTKPIRNDVTDSLVSSFPEVYENAKVNKAHAPSFEIPIRKGVLKRVEEELSLKGRNGRVVRRRALAEYQEEAIVPSERDAQPAAENLDAEPVHRAELDPVIRRMGTVFGARVVSIIDYQEPAVNSASRGGELKILSGVRMRSKTPRF